MFIPLVWPETSSVIKNNVLKTWALPRIFIWIDFRCLASDWRVLFHEFALNPESSTFGQSGGGEGEGDCFAPWNETTKHKQYIESRKRIAFCAPGFYRGQFPCQFSCFLFFVISASWKSPKVIVFKCWHLHGPSQIDSEHIWNFSWKHVFWGFRGHFDLILKSILKKYQMYIPLFDLKLLLGSRTNVFKTWALPPIFI